MTMLVQQDGKCSLNCRNVVLHESERICTPVPTTALTIMGGAPPHFNDRLFADDAAGKTSRYPPSQGKYFQVTGSQLLPHVLPLPPSSL